MSYYYVDDSGTATGDSGRFSTEQTGAFTDATSYASVYDVCNGVPSTAPVSGDIIVMSNTAIEAWAGAKDLGIKAGAQLRSALSTARQTYARGAKITTTSDIDFAQDLSGCAITLLGIDFECGNLGTFASGSILWSSFIADDCGFKLTTTSSGDYYRLSSGDGGFAKLTNCTFTNNASTSSSGSLAGSNCIDLILDNITLSSGRLFQTGEILAEYSGSNITLTNSDLSLHNTLAPIVTGVSSGDTLIMKISRTIIPSGIDIFGVDKISPSTRLDAWSVDNGSGYHYFEHQRDEGRVVESTSVYRVGGSYYKDGEPTTSNFSAQFLPNDRVIEYTKPLEIKIVDLELDLTSINTLTFQLAFGDDSNPIDTFTNAEAWIKLVQNDSTDTALGVVTESKLATITTTPTDLTSSSETWTGLTHANTDKRQIAIDTVAVPTMTNGQVTAYLCIAKYVDTLEIFCCAKPDVT